MIDLVRNLKAVLRRHEHWARKRLGQHFLVNASTLESIAASVEEIARSGDGDDPLRVLEIGCGPGNLTQAMLRRGLRVMAVELDRDFDPIHQEAFAEEFASGQLKIHHGDALNIPEEILAEFLEGANGYVLAGNIPYQITSPLIFQALERVGGPFEPAGIVFLMQEEVARRCVATPGGKDYGVLAAKLQLISEPRLLDAVPAGAFWPPPKVDSRVLEIRPLPPERRHDEARRAAAGRLIEKLFQQRRKMISTTLGRMKPEWRDEARAFLEAKGFPITARPETIPPELFLDMAEKFDPRLRWKP